jgi:hypothetical protein
MIIVSGIFVVGAANVAALHFTMMTELFGASNFEELFAGARRRFAARTADPPDGSAQGDARSQAPAQSAQCA